jgi:hypothetical protein
MMRSICVLVLLATLATCAPVKTPTRLTSNGPSTAQNSTGTSSETVSQEADGLSSVSLSGRKVDLYSIRAGDAKIFVPPQFDNLPCAYFKQGPEFEIPPVPGGPPIGLRGPVQNFYSGRWIKETEYTFKLSVYKRIYRDPGIPDWLLTKPTARVREYVLKLYDVVISSPTSKDCKISAVSTN